MISFVRARSNRRTAVPLHSAAPWQPADVSPEFLGALVAFTGFHRPNQISVCSEISRASSTSMPRYLTVDSSLECPSSS